MHRVDDKQPGVYELACRHIYAVDKCVCLFVECTLVNFYEELSMVCTISHQS